MEKVFPNRKEKRQLRLVRKNNDRRVREERRERLPEHPSTESFLLEWEADLDRRDDERCLF